MATDRPGAAEAPTGWRSAHASSPDAPRCVEALEQAARPARRPDRRRLGGLPWRSPQRRAATCVEARCGIIDLPGGGRRLSNRERYMSCRRRVTGLILGVSL